MPTTLRCKLRPDLPLRGHPQRHGQRIYFGIQRRADRGVAMEFGLWWFDLEQGSTGAAWAPFTFRDKNAGPEWTLLACSGDAMVAAVKWEGAYDCRHRFFRCHVGDEHWEYLALDDRERVDIDESSPWVAPPDVVATDRATLTGGAIHYWREGDTLTVVVADTAAFEHDDSEGTPDAEWEVAVGAHPMVRSNMRYRSLADYVGYDGDMYPQARANGLPNLPDAIPARHRIRDVDNIHDFWVAQSDSHTVFVRTEYPKGITAILHLVYEP